MQSSIVSDAISRIDTGFTLGTITHDELHAIIEPLPESDMLAVVTGLSPFAKKHYLSVWVDTAQEDLHMLFDFDPKIFSQSLDLYKQLKNDPSDT